jgi:hypothetical protein
VVIGKSLGQSVPKDRSVAALVGLSSCGHQDALRGVIRHGRRNCQPRPIQDLEVDRLERFALVAVVCMGAGSGQVLVRLIVDGCL